MRPSVQHSDSCPRCGTKLQSGVLRGRCPRCMLEMGSTLGDDEEVDVRPLDRGRFIAGTVLSSRYRIVGLLGRGGMGEVYKAEDLTLEKSIELARQLCTGLAAAHEAGMIHRDLKPANVMLDGRGQARLMDFGLSEFADELRTDEASGTPAYMAPEQLRGQPATTAS